MNIKDIWKITQRFYSPSEIGDPFAIDADADDTDDTNTDDDNKDDKKDDNVDDEDEEDKGDKDDDKDKDEGDEDDEKDDDDKEKDEKDKKDDKDEEDEPDEDGVRLTEVSDIKKAYPDFFKKFPDVRAALYRDYKYTEVVGTVEDAKSAVQKAGVLDQIEKDVVQEGNIQDTLALVQKENPKALDSIASGMMDFVFKNNKDLYYEMAALPIKQLLRAAWREGGKDTDLGRAAAHIHKYFFKDLNIDSKVKFEDGVGKTTEKTAREKELEQKLQALDTKTYTDFKNGADSSYISKMTNEVMSGLDKDDRLTDYAKTKLNEDILQDIVKQLNQDKRHTAQMNNLWMQAKNAGFTNDFKSRIVSAALARAKALIPATRQRLVSEALKSKKAKKDDNVREFKKDDNKEVRESRRDRNRDRDQPKKPLTDLDILRGS